ncbi:cytochrome c [Paraburkholderia adhaesiva]|uniref:cytochrome c n=1 Tax=Paraburkholderia adhaesiva TaxID=2883244 RepID=UPI00357158D4
MNHQLKNWFNRNQRKFQIWILAALTIPGQWAAAAVPAASTDADLVAHGAYVARVGDCVACHTAPEGKPMAGGLALNTPFGAVYSTNITPDETTGIGRYTFAEFDRVMRKGVAADGHNLYPAMPYPSYAKISDEDLHALFAYLKHGVQPVQQANKALGISWPFNMRWGLAVWNGLFLDDTPFTPSPAHDATWNRGAYLTQSLGHCGACHTPRGIWFQEKAMSDAGHYGGLYLSGAKVESWHAPDLRNLWTVDDLVTLLKTGQNRYASAAGGMTDVIHHSTQYMTDDDLKAMAVYMKSLPAGKRSPAAAHTQAVTTTAAAEPAGLFTSKGGLGYAQFCASCHQTDGRGVSSAFPPLAENPAVIADNTESLIHIALTGWKSAQTATYPRVYTMPSFDALSDRELADILTFVRKTWGGHNDAITASQVGKLRRELVANQPRTPPFETPRFAAMLDQPNAEQLVHGMRLNMQTKALLPFNVGDSLNCASCHLNGGTVAFASPYVGLSSQRGGRANSDSRISGLAGA